VAASQALLEIGPLLARPSEDLRTVLHRSAKQPETRVIGVVGDDGGLIGVVPILRLVESVVAHIVPESLLGDITDVEDVARFGHAVEARTMNDVMLPPATIAPEATIVDAFRVMHRRRLSGLYVVDQDSRPTGYLDMLELAMHLLVALNLDGDKDPSSEAPAPPTAGTP
jgi:CBS domain-containing protein